MQKDIADFTTIVSIYMKYSLKTELCDEYILSILQM